MIEVLGGFPTLHVVTLCTFAAELAFVRIAVAGRTTGGLAKEGFGKILHLDEFAIGRKHVRRSVTFFANKCGVLAFEFITRKPMIKFLLRRFPADQVEGFPVVLQVAADAVPAGGNVHLHFEMVAVLGGKILSHFLVAIETLEGRGACAECVARIALGSAA